MTVIYVDADACPVKEEVYRVARRLALEVAVVANSWIRTPQVYGEGGEPLIRFVQVEAGPDAADDWIAERAGPGDVVVTADMPLADRALKAGAQAVGPTGRPWTADNIGAALAGRMVGEFLRSTGEITSGARPFAPADRSRFLQALDAAVSRARRTTRAGTSTGSSRERLGRVVPMSDFAELVAAVSRARRG